MCLPHLRRQQAQDRAGWYCVPPIREGGKKAAGPTACSTKRSPPSTRPSDACASPQPTNVTAGDAEGGDVLEGYGEQLSRAHTRFKDKQIADVWGSILATARGWDEVDADT